MSKSGGKVYHSEEGVAGRANCQKGYRTIADNIDFADSSLTVFRLLRYGVALIVIDTSGDLPLLLGFYRWGVVTWRMALYHFNHLINQLR